MSLNSLYSQLARYQSEKEDCERKREEAIKKRDQAKKRKDAVRPIKDDLNHDFDNNCRGINAEADRMKSDVSNGILGIANASVIVSLLGADKELFPDVEENMSNAAADMQREYDALNEFYIEKKEEIVKLNNKISNLNWKIAQTKAEIAAEKARLAAEEAKEKLLEKING